MKTVPAPDDVSQLSKDLVDRVGEYITDKNSQYQVMAALNSIAGCAAFYIVAASERYHGVQDAWDQLLPRHVQAMKDLFNSVTREGTKP